MRAPAGWTGEESGVGDGGVWQEPASGGIGFEETAVGTA